MIYKILKIKYSFEGNTFESYFIKHPNGLMPVLIDFLSQATLKDEIERVVVGDINLTI